MAGGLSFLGGLFSFILSAATSNYVPKETREIREKHTKIFGDIKPTTEEKEIYDKWRNKRQNQRGEWAHKLDGGTMSQCKKIWWKHVFEDEGVEVSEDYLNFISGVSYSKFNSYMSTRRRNK